MNYDTIGAIAMDLKRAALGSGKTSQIFLHEAMKKRSEVKKDTPAYIKEILNNLEKDREQLLMQSILLQNYATKH